MTDHDAALEAARRIVAGGSAGRGHFIEHDAETVSRALIARGEARDETLESDVDRALEAVSTITHNGLVPGKIIERGFLRAICATAIRSLKTP